MPILPVIQSDTIVQLVSSSHLAISHIASSLHNAHRVLFYRMLTSFNKHSNLFPFLNKFMTVDGTREAKSPAVTNDARKNLTGFCMRCSSVFASEWGPFHS